MLLLTRRIGEKVIVDNNMSICVSGLHKQRLIVEFIGPKGIPITKQKNNFNKTLCLNEKQTTNILVYPREELFINNIITMKIQLLYGVVYRFIFEAPQTVSFWREELLTQERGIDPLLPASKQERLANGNQ